MARRRIEIEVLVDPKQARKGFQQTSQAARIFGRDIERAGRGAVAASIGFRGLGRSIGFASAAFLGGAGFVSAVKSSVSAASNLNEQISKSNVVFGKSAGAIDAWSKTTVNAMGLAQDQALETASSFGALLRPIGLTGSAAAAQSKRLTQLGADLASFYNTSVQDALDAIRSGLVGEVEPLRRYGVLLSETRVQQEALSETGKASVKQLTVQEKLMARLALIFRDTNQAQGDFQRTSGGLANQQRILSANIRQLQIGIGQALIPDILKVTTAMNNWLSKSENQKKVTDEVRGAVKTLDNVVAGVTPIIKSAAGAAQTFADAVGGARNAVKLLLIALAVRKLQQFAMAERMVGTEAVVAGGRVGLLRSRLASLPAFIGITVGLDIIANAHTTKHGVHRYSGKAGWGNLANDIAGVFGADWQGGHRAVQAAPVRPSPDTMEAAQTHRVEGPSGFAGRGSAGRLPTGMAALSRAQRNAIALSMARTPAQQLAALAEQRAILANQIRSVRSRLSGARGKEATKLATQLADLEQQDTQAFDQIASINEEAARKAKDAADRIATASKKRKDALERAHKAALAAAEKARRAMYDSIQGTLRAQFGGKDLSHGRKNLSVKDLVEQGRKAELASRQAAQFRALGLTSTGDVLAPTRKALVRETDLIAKQMRGTVLDTNANRNTIGRVRKVLSGQFGALTRETKLHVKELLDALKQPGDKEPTLRGRALNPASLTKGLGLTRAQARAIQFRIAGQHMLTPIGASGGVVVHNLTVHSKSDNPRQVARETIAALGKESGRRAKQVRGPHAGGDPTRFG